MTEKMEYVRPETIGQVAYAAYHLTTDGWAAMDAPSRKRWERIGHTVFDWGSGHAAAAPPVTGYGPDADALHAEVQADDAKDRLIAQLRQSLEDQVAENARQSRDWDKASRAYHDGLADLARQRDGFAAGYARLERELAEARAAIVALAPDAGAPQYAVVEAMGHRTLIGQISDVTVAGKAMLRLGRLDGNGEHYLAPDSLYMVTPCSESQARAAAGRLYGGLPATVMAAIGTGDVLEENALHHEVAAGAWGGDEEDPSNSDVDPDAYPDAYPDERDTDDDDREVIAPGDQDHGWPGPKGPF